MPAHLRRFAFALVLALPFAARASESYPSRIRSDLGLSYTPQCTLCHRTNSGGRGTVTTPFGKTTMSPYGLGAGSTSKLDSVLQQMEADGVDSDGDGVGDIAELRAGTDPNVANAPPPPPPDAGPGPTPDAGVPDGGVVDGGAPPPAPAPGPTPGNEPPTYGCNSTGHGLLVSALLLGALMMRRRRTGA